MSRQLASENNTPAPDMLDIICNVPNEVSGPPSSFPATEICPAYAFSGDLNESNLEDIVYFFWYPSRQPTARAPEIVSTHDLVPCSPWLKSTIHAKISLLILLFEHAKVRHLSMVSAHWEDTLTGPRNIYCSEHPSS